MTTALGALRALDQARERYEAEGYTYCLEERLPPPFDAFVADAVAKRNEELVIVEARSADMNGQTRDRLVRLADIVAAEAGWRVDIVTYEPEVEPQSPLREDIVRRIEEAQQVAPVSPDGAVLLAWSAVEGALRLAGNQLGLSLAQDLPPRDLVRSLAIDGVISDNQAKELDAFARMRNEVAHGRCSERPEPEWLDWLYRFALSAANNRLATVDDMVEWFSDHYATPEDAALIYDRDERDHMWFGTGPHDANDVLQAEFATALDADIAEAVEIIEKDGFRWAQKLDSSPQD